MKSFACLESLRGRNYPDALSLQSKQFYGIVKLTIFRKVVNYGYRQVTETVYHQRLQDPRYRHRIARGTDSAVEYTNQLSHGTFQNTQKGPPFTERSVKTRQSKEEIAELPETIGQRAI